MATLSSLYWTPQFAWQYLNRFETLGGEGRTYQKSRYEGRREGGGIKEKGKF